MEHGSGSIQKDIVHLVVQKVCHIRTGGEQRNGWGVTLRGQGDGICGLGKPHGVYVWEKHGGH